MKKTSEKKIQYIKEYDKRNYLMFTIKCRLGKDDDIIEALNSVGNKQQFIKAAIRKYFASR